MCLGFSATIILWEQNYGICSISEVVTNKCIETMEIGISVGSPNFKKIGFLLAKLIAVIFLCFGQLPDIHTLSPKST